MCVLIETAVRLGFTRRTNSKVLLLLTQTFADYETPAVPEHVGRKLCIDYVYFSLH
jgi:hypothetical protein